jgi:hypothetical protein
MDTRRIHVRELADALSPDEIERRIQDRVASLRAVAQDRALGFSGEANPPERALVSLFYQGQFAESDVRALTGYDHWQFLDLLARHSDLAPALIDPFAPVATLSYR